MKTVHEFRNTNEARSMSPEEARELVRRLTVNIESVIRGQGDSLRKLMAALATGGHVLLEDCPGTGKTTLAKALARSISADFKRIQFTPDLLPSDILGISMFNQREQVFEFCAGPIFANIVLADEINRASPRTQSALLEAMAEAQVSIEGERRPLPDFFFALATQNPVEFRGTYPLPEAQMDRFALQFELGYVAPDIEVEILTDQERQHPLDTLSSCAEVGEVLQLQRAVRDVAICPELKRYIVDLTDATRRAEGVRLGASPRGSLALMKTAQALALFDGLDFVTPDQIREVAVPVLAHRLVLDSQAKFSGLTARQVVSDLVVGQPIPV